MTEFSWPMYKIAEPHEENDCILSALSSSSYLGNARFTELLESKKDEYSKKSKLEQPLVAVEILKEWRHSQNPPGRFLVVEENTSPPLYKDVGDKKARSYISKTLKQMIMISDNKRSQAASKDQLRREVNSEDVSQGPIASDTETTVMTNGNDSIPSLDRDQSASGKSLLYDRDQQARVLLEAYSRRTSPSPPEGREAELALITGPSGTGKTILAKTTLQDVVEENDGYFLLGKFDQYRNKAKPFSAFVSAFEQFTKIVQSKGQTRIDKVKENILGSPAASHIRLLSEAMPCLGDIMNVGSGGDESESSDDESTAIVEKNRKFFTAAFKGFMKAIVDPQHPICLVLDDLQWADDGSLDLLTAVASPSFGSSQGLMIVGTCRGNEVSLHDPLSVVLRNLEEDKTFITDIQVSNLSVATLSEMLSDLGMTPDQSLPLAEIVYGQTKGNAFFASQYIQRIFEDGLLFRDGSSDRLKWNEDDLSLSSRSGGDTTNDSRIVALLAKKMMKLPSDVQEVLKVASCLGNELHESVLCHAGAIASSTVLLALSVAEERNFIIYDFDRCMGRFVHDRFQEAAYSLIPDDERIQYQLQIGYNLKRHLPKEDFEMHLLLVASLLAQGETIVKDEEEREQIARLCLAAARRAAKASAFASAIDYVDFGISFLQRRHWRDQYELSLLLFTAGAELAICNGDHETVDRLAAEVDKNARSSDDTFQADVCRIMSLDARYDVEAFFLGLRRLGELGVPFPKKATKATVMLDFMKTQRMLRGKTPERISALPPMEDKKALAAMQVVHLLYPVVLLHRFAMTPLCAFRLVRLTLEHGLSPMSGLGFAFYSVVLVRLGRVDEGRTFANLALKITAKAFRARTTFVVNAYTMPETESLRTCLKPLKLAYKLGLKTGDVHASVIARFFHHLKRFFLGESLDSLVNSVHQLEKDCIDYGQLGVLVFRGPMLQSCYSLMGRSTDPLVLTGEAMREEDFRDKKDDFNQSMWGLTLLFKVHVAVFMNEFDHAHDTLLEELKKVKALLVIPFTVKHLAFLESLIAEARASGGNNLLQGWHRKKILKYLKDATLLSPENYAHKLYFVEAERAASNGAYDLAFQKFERAIRCAENQGIPSDQGFACERVARTYLSLGKKADAARYISVARRLYQQWGAKVKVAQMDKLTQLEKLDLPEESRR